MNVLTKRHWMMALLCGLALLVSLACLLYRGDDANGSNSAQAARVDFWGDRRVAAALQSGFKQAEQAASLAQTANSAEQWDNVVEAWTGAISTLQTIPTQSPERFFAQRKQREYLTNLVVAQQQANQLSWPNVFPNLGSPVLDEQLRLYLSYLATFGPPDVLIIGSSRSLQGLDPQLLQKSLDDQGYPVRVFNFSINGATAQVMNFVLQRLLTPDQLPRLVIWGDGSRAFNSRRVDATFARILASPGFQAVLAGKRPGFSDLPPSPRQPSTINAYGFLPVPAEFDPAIFYQTYPRVNGRYDAFYNPFGLTGLQLGSLRSLVGYLKSRNIDLIYVNLPLSGDYLDTYRLSIDRRFQRFLQTQSQRQGFTVIDLLSQWTRQNAFFADPSHLNQKGAAALVQQLARNPLLLEKLSRLELE
ncbi:MAG: D-alanyl-lipoteichoic acid biosynthesis protein DltD [Cyanobacteria bacterium P01_F01_bin.13]